MDLRRSGNTEAWVGGEDRGNLEGARQLVAQERAALGGQHASDLGRRPRGDDRALVGRALGGLKPNRGERFPESRRLALSECSGDLTARETMARVTGLEPATSGGVTTR